MDRCAWCGKQQGVFEDFTRHGYCMSCEAMIRDDITARKNDMELLLVEVRRCKRPCEKQRLFAMLEQTYTGLKRYKKRNVPFFKSDIEQQHGDILAAIEAITDEPISSNINALEDPKALIEKHSLEGFRSIKIVGAVQKSIILEQNLVRIVRDESLTGSRREKAIPIKQISGVEVKEPGVFVKGFIQIQTPGQRVSSSSFTYTGGAFGAVSDENSVLFMEDKDYKTALKMKEYIESYREPPTVIITEATAAPSVLSVADEIVKLKELLDAGTITQSEFDKQKSKLLS